MLATATTTETALSGESKTTEARTTLWLIFIFKLRYIIVNLVEAMISAGLFNCLQSYQNNWKNLTQYCRQPTRSDSITCLLRLIF